MLSGGGDKGFLLLYLATSYELIMVNGESPQEFIRDGTKDYIRNLAKNSVTSLEGSGFENQEQPKEE